MARLKAEHKLFIVQRLACFDSPSLVVDAVKEEYGIQVTRQAVEAYDPTKNQGRALGQRLRGVFEETREQFLADTSGIAISHKAVRLRALQRMAERAEVRGNMVLAASLLEQAAKEAGDAFTNKRNIDLNNPDGTLQPVINLLRK